MDMHRMKALAHNFGHWNPSEQRERTIIFHDGSENTPIMLEETREIMEYSRSMWGPIGAALKRSGVPVATDQLFVEALQPIMMADGTAVTGTTEASLWPIQFSTFAAGSNFIHKAQQHIEWVSFGVFTTPGATPGTCTITPRWGTTTGGAALGASAASATLTVSKTNVPWYCNGNLQVRSLLAGANSVMVSGGDFICDQVAIPGLCFGGTVVSTVDVTAAGGIWTGITLGSASDSVTARALILKNVS